MSEGFKLSLSIIQSIAKKLNFSIVFLDLVSFSNLFNNLVRWLRKSSFKHTYLLFAESLHNARIFEKSRNLSIIAITLPNKSGISGFSDFRLSKWNVVSPWIWFEFFFFLHFLNWIYISSRYFQIYIRRQNRFDSVGVILRCIHSLFQTSIFHPT